MVDRKKPDQMSFTEETKKSYILIVQCYPQDINQTGGESTLILNLIGRASDG